MQLTCVNDCRIRDALKSAKETRKYNETKLKKEGGAPDYPDEARPV